MLDHAKFSYCGSDFLDQQWQLILPHTLQNIGCVRTDSPSQESFVTDLSSIGDVNAYHNLVSGVWQIYFAIKMNMPLVSGSLVGWNSAASQLRTNAGLVYTGSMNWNLLMLDTINQTSKGTDSGPINGNNAISQVNLPVSKNISFSQNITESNLFDWLMNNPDPGTYLILGLTSNASFKLQLSSEKLFHFAYSTFEMRVDSTDTKFVTAVMADIVSRNAKASDVIEVIDDISLDFVTDTFSYRR